MNQANNHNQDNAKNQSKVDFQHWQNLISSTSRADYFASWLAIVSASIGDVENATVMVHEDENIVPAGSWPESGQILSNEAYLIAKDAVLERKALIEKLNDSDAYLLSYPMAINDELIVAVVMQVSARSQQALGSALQQLQLGSAWLELIFRREEAQQDEALVDQAVSTLGLMSRVSEQTTFHGAAMELVTVLANELHCEKVIYGVYKKSDMDLVALSNNGQFGRKMNLMSSVADMMLEAVDQQRSIRFPLEAASEQMETDSATNLEIAVKHQQFAQRFNSVSVMTVPVFTEDGECLGVVALERSKGQAFEQAEQDLVVTISHIALNMIDEKRRNEWSIGRIVRERINRFWQTTVSNQFPLRNAILGGIVAVLLLGFVLPGNLEIKANTFLEGYVERAVVAPFDGFIQLSEKRVGDAVKKGEVLGSMDSSELELELTDLLGQQSQSLSQIRESQAAGDRARAKIFQTQLLQVQAQINLLKSRIQRTNLLAPYDGYIVRGDLSRQLGAAINRGDVMFVVAPLEKYRVVMQVDERDISYIEEGNSARLIFSALPSERIDTKITDITPIATAAAGRNFFRVEAELSDDQKRLRPGMEGVVRIEAGRHNLMWIWVREFVDWMRIFIWKWLP